MLLDDVEIVEQPLAGRADVHLAVGGVGQPLVRLVQDAAGLVQPDEEAGASARGPGRDALGARERSRTLAEVLGTEQLAADRAGEKLVGGGGGPGEQARQARQGQTDTDRSGLAVNIDRAQLVGSEPKADTGWRNLAGRVRAPLVRPGVCAESRRTTVPTNR